MKRFTYILFGVVALVLVFTMTSDANRLQWKTKEAEVVSASAVVSPAGSATVYTTPADYSFTLTQVCHIYAEEVMGIYPPALGGKTKGPIADDNCVTYSPGIAFPKNEDLTATNHSDWQTLYITITGLLTQN